MWVTGLRRDTLAVTGIQMRKRSVANWLDRQLYPFESHYVDVDDGRMHYVDEGSGATLLMLHGTPTWSFLYRHLITGLRDQYRVIAPDHLGSGLSDRPTDYSYRPADQARNLRAFIEALDLRDITLFVHDFGGPIGLSYALEHPENIRRLVLFNTWMWSLKGDRQTRITAGILGSGFGRLLYQYLDVEFRVIIPAVFPNWAQVDAAIQDHYRQPMDDTWGKTIAWMYARELMQSSAWFDSLWAKREVLQDVPALLMWGMQDQAFGPAQLTRWQTVLPQAVVHTLPDTGHFVQEEQGANLLPVIRAFLEGIE